MSRRVAILLVASMLATCWVGALTPVLATDSRSNEGMSIVISKEVWSSSETFEATVGLWGLSMGRAYTLEWQIRTGNGTLGPNVIVDNGYHNFTANSSAIQVQIEANHLDSSSTHLHRLLVDLSDNSGSLIDNQANFSSFTNTLPVAYSDIIFFGDSLSDMGNSFNQWGTPDSPPYWNGRFSNGEVWAEQFGRFMGLSMSAGRGSANGNNRAYGGAHSGDGTYLFVIPNVGQQVDDYLQNHQINANELVVIFCGGNDFVHSDETDTQQVVDNIEGHMTDLTGAGATEFLILDLPPLDTVPRVAEERDAAGVAAMHERILDFNQKLHTMLDDTVNSTSLTIHRGMAWGMFDIVYNNPSHFGLTNITHPACDHDGYTCEEGDTIAANAEEYIFFDKMHPTLTMHDLIDLYIRELMGVNDIDGDGLADIYDNCTNTLPGIEIGSDGCDIPPPDTDEDGVIDDEDACPGTDTGLGVDENGCATNQIDSDQDGVMDDVDQCPDTQPGWEVNSIGCSSWETDGDSDGVVDAEDDCPNTDQGEDIDGDGCADNQLDSDDDGVTDDLDACPETPREELVNELGCSGSQLDEDADGISNIDDACPNTPIGEVEVNSQGCGPSERDSDEDGVNDHIDACPDTEWLHETDANGCAANQRDTDGDGRKDSVDGCPEVWGSLNGCPILSIELGLVESPDSETRTANLSITISCESDCHMSWALKEGDAIISEDGDAFNGIYYVSYTNTVDESRELNARVSIDGMWKDTMLTVYFPPIGDDTESTDNQTDSVNQNTDANPSDATGNRDVGFEMDSGSIAMIAMLILVNVGVVAAIMAVRSKSRGKKDGRELSMAAFERDLFAESEPLASIPATDPPSMIGAESVQPVVAENSDLPSIEDLLD